MRAVVTAVASRSGVLSPGAGGLSRSPTSLCVRVSSIPCAKVRPLQGGPMSTIDTACSAPTLLGEAAAGQAGIKKVQVRLLAEGQMTISLAVADKQRNLNRPRDEPLQKALARLRASVQPAPAKDNKKAKKRAGPESQPATVGAPDAQPNELFIALFSDAEGTRPMPEEERNEHAWPRASLLVVGAERFAVEVNSPFVEKVTVPKRLMVGFPVLGSAQLLHADPSLSRWRWIRRRPGQPQQTGGGEVVGEQQLYTPTQEDIGCLLSCEVTPGQHRQAQGSATASVCWGKPCSGASPDVVEAAPELYSALVRGHSTRGVPASPPRFRVLSYNLLADQYAGSTYAKTVLFDYCPERWLDPDYRSHLIIKELQAYAADILCLQEVDARLFNDVLAPHLALAGLEGHFTNKQGKVREGSATFWRRSRFRRLLSADIKLRDVFRQPLAPAHAQWQPMLDASPNLVEALRHVTTIAQACLLQPEGKGSQQLPPLLVINTHLFFHPYAPHVRTMHTAAVLEEAAALLQHLAASTSSPNVAWRSAPEASAGDHPVLLMDGITAALASEEQRRGLEGVAAALLGRRPALLFCGDLNSDLNDGMPGVIELLQKGRLSADHWDWHMGANFRWGMGEEEGTPEQQASAPQPPRSAIATAVQAAKAASGQEATPAAPLGISSTANEVAASAARGVVGIELQLPLAALRSADNLATPFTNYTSGYKALLDYIWYQPGELQVAQVHPVPQELDSFIPSAVFPSDHLAVVFDLEPAQQ